MKKLPKSWPAPYAESANECYERVMTQLIKDTKDFQNDVPNWVIKWSDSIGSAIILAFSIGVAWREQFPNEPAEVDDAPE